MKKLYNLILALFVSGSIAAQQEAMYSQYMFNMLAVNPAYAGSREVVGITGLTRAQWVGMEGAPVSTTLSIDAPIKTKRIGIGAQLFNERIGVTSSNGIYGSYAYRVKFKKSILAMGLQTGLLHYRADYTQVQLTRSGTSNDKSFQENASVLMPSIGSGLFLSGERYYIGASLPNMFATQIKSGSDLEVNKTQHLFLSGGFVFALNTDFKLKPSFLLRAVKGAPAELDLNLNLWMYDRLGLGASYRTGDAAVAMVEFMVYDNFKVGYAYDYSLTALRYFHSGSHELLLKYEFGNNKSKENIPRYF